MTDPVRSSHAYRLALRELKARGEHQACWSCGKELRASLPKGDANSITLGHYTALEDGGDPYDPNNYGPQCMADNYGDGARRTNKKRSQKIIHEHYEGSYI